VVPEGEVKVTTDMGARFKETVKEVSENDPPIEVGQIWSGKDEDGVVLRRVRILAMYPPPKEWQEESNWWIYEDLPGVKLRIQAYRIGRIPEFNLRYVMRPEDD
jgi:hypothetical protein